MQTESMDVLYYFDFLYQGNHDEVVAEALAAGTPLEGLIAGPRRPGAALPADDDAGPRRRLPAPVPAEHRDADERLPGADRAVPGVADQRLLHGPAVLGEAAVQDVRRESYQNQRRVLDELVSSYVVPK